MGVSEMTRFGMTPVDFGILAGLMADHIQNGSSVKDEVVKFRDGFTEMLFCFNETDVPNIGESLIDSLR
jgi:glycine/serine hydroxymethyltransferase